MSKFYSLFIVACFITNTMLASNTISQLTNNARALKNVTDKRFVAFQEALDKNTADQDEKLASYQAALKDYLSADQELGDALVQDAKNKAAAQQQQNS